MREEMRTVKLRRMAESFQSPKNRRAGQFEFLAFRHDRFIQRPTVVLIVFADVNPD
jgi:hypothetical protein